MGRLGWRERGVFMKIRRNESVSVREESTGQYKIQVT